MGKRKLSNIQQNWNARVDHIVTRVPIPDNSERIFVKNDSVKLSCKL